MENKEYNVLWIDDEIAPESINNAYVLRHTILNPVGNYSKGLSLLEENNYDAVILDVYCIEKEGEAPSFDVFKKYLNRISIYCDKNAIPWFVYTGGVAGAKENSDKIETLVQAMRSNSMFNGIQDYYNKPSDFSKLLNDIAYFADSRRETQLKNKYKDILSVLSSTVDINLLLQAIKHIEGDEKVPNGYLNQYRQLLESLRDYLCENGFLPEQLTSCPLNKAKAFFTSRELLYSKLENPSGLVPPYIQKAFYYITDVTQEGSHGGLEASDDVRSGRAPYLFDSIFQTLFTLFYWLSLQDKSVEAIKNRKGYVNKVYNQIATIENKAPDVNPQDYEGLECEVQVDESGRYFYEQCLLPDITQNNVTRVKLVNVGKNKKKDTQHIYQLFAHYEIIK